MIDAQPPQPPIGFVLAIQQTLDGEGKPQGYRVGHDIKMPREPLITLVRAWLRRIEKEYDEYFAGQH